MQKIKRFKTAIVAVLILSMLAVYGSVPQVRAASLQSLKDTISDSTPSASEVTHTIDFHMGADLTAGQYVRVTFEGDIDLTEPTATTTCPVGSTGSASGQYIQCTVDGGQTMASSSQIIFTDAINPADTGDYSVTVSTHEVGGVEIESSEVKIYIIEQVTVTARVPATLAFSIGTTTPEQSVHSENFTATSSPTSIAFGTLDTDTDYLMGHVLNVSTNADDGFVVTVHQDGNLRTAAGADIDGFSTSTPKTWDDNHPAADINDENTWGHIGVTSDDTDSFTASTYQGLHESDPMTVLTHDGPVAGSGTGSGETLVAYKLRISALQEAGDYRNLLTYICTPTY